MADEIINGLIERQVENLNRKLDAYTLGAKDERERCAKICEQLGAAYTLGICFERELCAKICEHLAATIRKG